MIRDVLFDAVHEIERCQQSGWGSEYDGLPEELAALKDAMRKMQVKLDELPVCCECGGPLESD